jgi:alanyl-tRNA synthetase
MVLDIIRRRLEAAGFPLQIGRGLIPPPDDESTLFVSAGMQPVRPRFRRRDGGRAASLQSCLRLDDLELVGDGVHLTYFEMVGSFSFGDGEYGLGVELWDGILRELAAPVTHVTVHPDRPDHRRIWEGRGRTVVLDPDCVWSDGEIGGHCAEIFCGDVEIGTAVNPAPDMTDVGFGWERLHQVLEGVPSVFATSLFAAGCSPMVADHLRALEHLLESGVSPGNKGREYVFRKLARRMLREWRGTPAVSPALAAILESERKRRDRVLERCGRLVRGRRWRDMPAEWWWDTHGLLPEELDLLRGGHRCA